MPKVGYFVDEQTIERMTRSMDALNAIRFLLADTSAQLPSQELYALLTIVQEYAGHQSLEANFGHWQQKEAHRVQKSL